MGTMGCRAAPGPTGEPNEHAVSSRKTATRLSAGLGIDVCGEADDG
jgi:hypothetical protein